MAIKYVNLNQGITHEGKALTNCVIHPAYIPITRTVLNFETSPEVINGTLPLPIFPAYEIISESKTIGPFDTIVNRSE